MIQAFPVTQEFNQLAVIRNALTSVLFIASVAQSAHAAEQTYPGNVYWGDTHVHTSNSNDAGRYTILVGPEQAYRFARGEEVATDWGTNVRLRRPLDFLVVADHAGNIGVLNGLRAADPILLANDVGNAWYQQFKASQDQAAGKQPDPAKGSGKASGRVAGSRLSDDNFTRSVWQNNCEVADRLNQPGEFTALIGYEWTPQPKGNNLHRVLIFGDGANKAGKVLPFSAADSEDSEDLWNYMAEYEKATGGRILAIPHNANMSNGLMFSDQTFTGKPMTREYAETRSRWEPLVEITQLKGASEAHPSLSPDDEFADYRLWDRGNMWVKQGVAGPNAKQPWMLAHEYARPVLKLGLDQQATLGVNPFKFGMIGGTDSHTGLPTTWNDSPVYKPEVIETRGADYSRREPSQVGQAVWEQTAGGLAAVWASDNTREDLFEAMARRETYATTGPRITVRMFAGWDFDAADSEQPDLAAVGYKKGVPMGGDLTHAPKDKGVTILVRATRDATGANLDRIQIIKGWRDAKGELHERIYNVALADGREVSADGSVAPVGNTVNIKAATYTNSIGDPELATVWHDPDFNASHRAFYYARVLEIPRPRWTDFDALGVTPSKDFPMTIVERAYTSPIWYTP